MLTPVQIASVNAGYWAMFNSIKLQSGVFSTKTREYQIEPLSSKKRRTCYMKATQLGFTEMEVLRSLHGLIHRRYARGILYLFPTNDDVLEFGKSRFNPLIQSNRNAIGKYVKSSGSKNTDTASLKKIHDAFLWLRGARLTRKIDEQDESSKMRSISVDRIVFDELDLMADTDSEFKVVGKARGRLGDSELKEECYISNPTTPNFGIDEIFSKSDQRHWFRKCNCGEWTCAEESFPGCVKIRSDGTGYIGCSKCGNELGIYPGEWVPAVRDNSEYMYGYQLSQLTSVRNDPAEVLEDYTNPPEGNLSDVIRLRLGLPHIAAEDKLKPSDVYACCGGDLERISHPGPCAMGVDVGRTKYIVIGVRTGNDRFKILKTTQMSDWSEIYQLAKKFNVRSTVIDIRPYEDSARAYQKRAGQSVFLCEYKESTPLGSSYNVHTGIVQVCRTEIMDATHRLITTPGRLEIPKYCPDIVEFAKQLCSPFKILEVNKKTKVSVYRYRKTSYPDHFRHALNYFYLAASGGKVAKVGTARRRQKVANNNYARV